MEAHIPGKEPDEIRTFSVVEKDENHILMDSSGKDYRRLHGIYLGDGGDYPVAALHLTVVMDQATKRMFYSDVTAIFNGGKSPSFHEGNYTRLSDLGEAPLVSFLNRAFGKNESSYAAQHLKDLKAGPSRSEVIDAIKKLDADKQISPALARNVIDLLENIREPASEHNRRTIDATTWIQEEDGRKSNPRLTDTFRSK
jgi:hypothetical protein